jgi:hypothetical protein
MSSTSPQDIYGSEARQQAQQQEILDEASALTRSLYRLCLRSVRLLRRGNLHDEREFAAREEQQLQDMVTAGSSPIDERYAISMLPPVAPQAELEARSDYYAQYSRENFFAESDALSSADQVLRTRHFDRYFFHLRRGEEHRVWLLEDMKFEDPRPFDLPRVAAFEQRVQQHFKEMARIRMEQLSPDKRSELQQAQVDYEEYNSDDEAFSDDEDEDSPPVRHKNKNRRFGEDDD